MMDSIDVRGLSCPLPVLKTQKALARGITELQVIGSGNTSKQNVSKFACSTGLCVDIQQDDGDEWILILKKTPK